METNKVDTGLNEFDIAVSNLDTETDPLYYRGLPLLPNSQNLEYLGAQEVLETAKRFPSTLSCLSRKPRDKTISLARLNTTKFDKTADLEICLQRVANELGTLSKVKPWLRAIGFSSVKDGSISHWLAAKSLGQSSDKVAVFIADWRGQGNLKELLYPMSAKYNLVNVLLSLGFYPRNMYLTLVIRREDVRVISVSVVMIFL